MSIDAKFAGMISRWAAEPTMQFHDIVGMELGLDEAGACQALDYSVNLLRAEIRHQEAEGFTEYQATNLAIGAVFAAGMALGRVARAMADEELS